jgi:hypothetical protein
LSRAGAALLCALGVALGAGCASKATPAPLFGEQHARSLSAPSRWGWLSSKHDTSDLPSAIPLGGKQAGRVLIYLEFPPPDGARELARAELLLTPLGQTGQVDVELSRADAAGPELRSWSDQPRALYPRLSASIAARPWPARVDVTELVRALRKSGEPLRLLLRAEPGDRESVLIATGASGGDSPKLELYYR